MTGVFVALVLLVALRADDGADESVKVTVVVVLASTQDKVIDPQLIELARQVRRRDHRLTGFKLMATEVKSIPVGESATVPLVDKQELKVKVEAGKDANGRVSLTIKAPEVGELSYACKCDKFFPVVTGYQTAKGEQLIIAVMGKPATGKK
jgi:hypothetical protein